MRTLKKAEIGKSENRETTPAENRETTRAENRETAVESFINKETGSLAVGSTNGTLQVWDLERRTLKRQWTENTGEVRPEAFLAAGSKLVTTSMDTGMHHERDLGATNLPIQSWPFLSGLAALSLSPDDRYCLSFGYGGDYASERSDWVGVGSLAAVSGVCMGGI